MKLYKYVFPLLFIFSCRTTEVSNDEGNPLPVSFEKPVPVSIDKPTPVTFDRPVPVTFDNPPTQVVVVDKKPFEKYLKCIVAFPTLGKWMDIPPDSHDRVIESIILNGSNPFIKFTNGSGDTITVPFQTYGEYPSRFAFNGRILIPANKTVQFHMFNLDKMYIFGRIEQ